MSWPHLAAQGEPSYRAKQVADWLYKKRVDSFAAMTDLPAAIPGAAGGGIFFRSARSRPRPRLEGHDPEISLPSRRRQPHRIGPHPGLAGALRRDVGSPDDLRFDPGRLCLRLQVLRERAGRFLAQSRPGRDRRSGARVRSESGERIDNIVFMGMGEPLANLTNLLRAIRIINAPWGLGDRRAPHHHLDQRSGAANPEAGRPSRPNFGSPSRCTARPTKCAARSCR